MLSKFWILGEFAYEASRRCSHTHEASYAASFLDLYISIFSPPTLKSSGWGTHIPLGMSTSKRLKSPYFTPIYIHPIPLKNLEKVLPCFQNPISIL